MKCQLTPSTWVMTDPSTCPTCGIHRRELDWIVCDRCVAAATVLAKGFQQVLRDKDALIGYVQVETQVMALRGGDTQTAAFLEQFSPRGGLTVRRFDAKCPMCGAFRAETGDVCRRCDNAIAVMVSGFVALVVPRCITCERTPPEMPGTECRECWAVRVRQGECDDGRGDGYGEPRSVGISSVWSRLHDVKPFVFVRPGITLAVDDPNGDDVCEEG